MMEMENVVKGIQEPVKPFIDEYGNPRCGKCHRRLFCVDDKDSFCSKCGQAVKWE